jgi:hypothetical protein
LLEKCLDLFPEWSLHGAVLAFWHKGLLHRGGSDPAIKVCLVEIHRKLKETDRIANAAEACARAGSM